MYKVQREPEERDLKFAWKIKEGFRKERCQGTIKRREETVRSCKLQAKGRVQGRMEARKVIIHDIS